MDNLLLTPSHSAEKTCNISFNSVGQIFGDEDYYRVIKSNHVTHVTSGDRPEVHGLVVVLGKECTSILDVPETMHLHLVISGILLSISALMLVLSANLHRLLKRIRSNDETCEVVRSGLSLSGDKGSEIMNWFKLMTILFCFRSVSTCVPENRTTTIFGASRILMAPGESVCTAAGHILLESAAVVEDLELMYEANTWSLVNAFDWGCASGSCPSTDDCLKLDNRLSQGKTFITKKVCKMVPRACAFGRGCWFGYMTIKWNADTQMSIYRPSAGIIRTEVKNLGSNCSLLAPDGKQSLTPFRYFVKRAGEVFACNSVSPKGVPSVGMIGDLQIQGNVAQFSWNSIKCEDSWFGDHRCEETHHSSLQDICAKLPAVLDGQMVTYSNGQITTHLSSLLTVDVSCSDDIVVHRVTKCIDVAVHVEGLRSSGRGISIAASAKSLEPGDSIEITLNCSVPVIIFLPCDGITHYYSHTEVLDCDGVKDMTTLDTSIGQVSKGSDSEPLLTWVNQRADALLLNSSALMVVVIILIICFLALKR